MNNWRASAFGVALLIAYTASTVRVSDAESSAAAAEREYRLGYLALQRANCAEALVHYRRSLALVQRPRTLFNIATCEEDLGQHAAAWRDYHAFLNLAEDRDASIIVEARARIEALRKHLRGQIAVESNVGGAVVSVDGERQARGETPVTLSLEPGRHLLRVSMPGAVAVERTVEIAPDEITSLRVELALQSQISIRTDPADAVIEPQSGGATAIGRFEMPVQPGRYTFVIRRDGYQREQIEIDALAGRTHELRISLKPEPSAARLVVTGAAGAIVTVDGKPTAKTTTIDLRAMPVGDHDIAIEQSGRIVWRRSLQFSPGEIVRLDVDLPPRRSSTRRAIGWGAGGLGVASIGIGGVVGTLALRDVTSPSVDLHDRGKTRALVADGLFVAGVGALVVAWRLLRSENPSARIRRGDAAP